MELLTSKSEVVVSPSISFSSHVPHLHFLLSWRTRESIERVAKIPDVDEETFARFVEFLYTGDYNSPSPAPVHEVSTGKQGSDNDEHQTSITAKTLPHAHDDSMELYMDTSPELVPEVPEPEPDRWGFATTRKDRKKQKQSAVIPGSPLDQKHSKLPDPDISAILACPLPTSSKIRRNIVGRNDYAALFVCHAQLYILGDKYDVRPLKVLASERLSRSFRHYERAELPSADFPNLVRYVFEHTPERVTCEVERRPGQGRHTPSEDILQQICVHFAANNFESLILSSGFNHLLREGELFVEMFFAQVAERFARM